MAKQLTADRKICYIVAFAILAVLLLSLLIPAAFVRWCVAVLLGLATWCTYTFIKKRSIHSLNKNQAALILSVSACLFVVLYYVSGLRFGFASSLLPISLSSFALAILPIALIVLFSEWIRGVLVAQNSALTFCVAFCIGVLSEIFITGGVLQVNSAHGWVDFFGMTVFPAITANVLYNYTSKRYGFLPNLIYRLILTLYSYIIPFVPAAPKIIPAFLLLVLPLALYLFVKALFEKKQRTKTYKKRRWVYVIWGAGVAVTVSLILLISCQFRFGMIVIASPSMMGELNMGDAVVYEDYEYCQPIQENDIIVFSKSGNKNIVHRVIKIEKVNGQVQYITKGDANDDADMGFVTDDQIVGVVRFKVLYIGYPSLWLYKMTD